MEAPARTTRHGRVINTPSRYTENAAYLFQTMIDGLVNCHRPQEQQYRHIIALLTSVEQGSVEGLPPTIGECMQALKAKKYDEDNPHYTQAILGKHANEYKAAMEIEVQALERVNTWTEMLKSEVPKGCTVLPLTWAFKLKRYPDGSPRKFKARLCVRGDKQTEGVDYFEKYAPVVSWSSVRMLLTLTAREQLKTRLVDFTNAFAQANLKEEVYVELPRMFDSPNGPETVLKLNKSLYGLVQAPLSWYNHLTNGLEDTGFTKSDNDPCLFFGNNMMVLVYVDDCIFFGKDAKAIDAVIEHFTTTVRTYRRRCSRRREGGCILLSGSASYCRSIWNGNVHTTRIDTQGSETLRHARLQQEVDSGQYDTAGNGSKRATIRRHLGLRRSNWNATLFEFKQSTGYSIRGTSMRQVHAHTKNEPPASDPPHLSISQGDGGQRFEFSTDKRTHLGLLCGCGLCRSLQCREPHRSSVCQVSHRLCFITRRLPIVLVVEVTNGDRAQHDRS